MSDTQPGSEALFSQTAYIDTKALTVTKQTVSFSDAAHNDDTGQ